jgi:nucleotide-binding universal stress UspA family protein
MTKPDPELIKRILIPFDFSETAELSMEQGLFLAKIVNAEITLLHIVENVSFTSAISQALGGVEKKIESVSQDRLQAYANEVQDKHGLPVSIRTEVGRVYRKIIEVAKDMKSDLVIMGTHGSAGYQKFSLGTNTSRVVQECPCPVLSVQSHAKEMGFKKILLPIDESNESRQKVPFAVGLAQFYNAQIILLGIINFSGDDLIRRFKIKIEQVEDYVVNHGLDYETVYREGNDLAGITLKSAEELDADLLVIMTEQEPSITGFLLGTYATRVVNNSRIPVISIHPAEVDPDKITVRF